MKFSIATLFLTAVSLASAEDFTVIVGKTQDGSAANVFTPDQVKAKVGDRIHFEFHPKNHTVTQSSFAEPCTRQRNTVTKDLGVDSGFMAVAPNATDIPVWSIEVKQDTAPIWLFCNQGNHCNSGMVFAINAPQDGEKSFSAWKEKAKTAKHPNPADNVFADFTPPAAGTGAPKPASSTSEAPSPSATSSTPGQPPAGSSVPGGPVTGTAIAAPSALPTADQANSPLPSASTKPSGALSAVQVPGVGIALTLAGLLAGMIF